VGPLTRGTAFAALALLIALVAVACGAGEPAAPVAPGVPGPKQHVPRDPAVLAATLTGNRRALHRAIDRWRSRGDPSHGPAPKEVVLRALYHQRIHILLSDRPRLARATIRRLPRSLAAEARDLVAARRALVRLTTLTPRRRFRTGAALPPARLLRYYRQAERRFGVSRTVLAAVNLVETGFDRLRSPSTAGAQGPMQFLPATWRAYGLGGDVHDPHDAILGAANYLHASGAPASYRRALYSYNPSALYVSAVLHYARAMRRGVDTYYTLQNWQVFVRTTHGLRRLTGPRPR
jgi:membrane-bound lytic murein transglycosylase B